VKVFKLCKLFPKQIIFELNVYLGEVQSFAWVILAFSVLNHIIKF